MATITIKSGDLPAAVAALQGANLEFTISTSNEPPQVQPSVQYVQATPELLTAVDILRGTTRKLEEALNSSPLDPDKLASTLGSARTQQLIEALTDFNRFGTTRRLDQLLQACDQVSRMRY